MADAPLGQVVCALNRAVAPLRAAWHDGEALDLEAVLGEIRKSYGLLTGAEPESLAADVTVAAQRLRLSLLVTHYALELADFARAVASSTVRDESDLLAMLKQSRALVKLIEKYLVGRGASSNVVSLAAARPADAPSGNTGDNANV